MEKNRQGGTRDERARATRRKILVEATKLFARQGFHRTTTVDLAAAIGMTQGALFHHFDSKQSLLEAVVDRLARGMTAYREVLGAEATPDSVERVIRLMVDHFNRQPEATVCLAALATEFAGTDDPVLERIRGVYEVFVGPMAAALAQLPTIPDPRAAAIVLIGAAQGLAVQGLLREGTPSLPALAEAFLRMLDRPERW